MSNHDNQSNGDLSLVKSPSEDEARIKEIDRCISHDGYNVMRYGVFYEGKYAGVFHVAILTDKTQLYFSPVEGLEFEKVN